MNSGKLVLNETVIIGQKSEKIRQLVNRDKIKTKQKTKNKQTNKTQKEKQKQQMLARY